MQNAIQRCCDRVKNGTVSLSRTLTHDLIIEGTGFTSVYPPHFVFQPPLERDDYVVKVSHTTTFALAS